MNNYLIIQLAFLGDVVLSLPMAEYIKRKDPAAHVIFLTIPAGRDIAGNCPFVDEALIFDKTGGDAGISGLLRTARRLNQYRFKAVFSPHKLLRSRILTRLISAEYRYGFRKYTRNIFYTHRVPYLRAQHCIVRNLSLVRAYWDDPDTSIILPRLQVQAGKTDTIGLAPGSVWNTKRYPEEKWAELICHPAMQEKPLRLIGGKGDAAVATRILELVNGRHPRLENRVGLDTLPQSFARIAECKLLISNDSAPQHFAMAVDTPVIAVFGSTVKDFGFYPVGPHDKVVETGLKLPCRPCGAHGKKSCPIQTFDCMRSIGIAQIIQKMQEIESELAAQI